MSLWSENWLSIRHWGFAASHALPARPPPSPRFSRLVTTFCSWRSSPLRSVAETAKTKLKLQSGRGKEVMYLLNDIAADSDDFHWQLIGIVVQYFTPVTVSQFEI